MLTHHQAGTPKGAAPAASLGAVLDSRDRRAARQKYLLAVFGHPLLSMTLVSPGAVKDSPGRRRLMDMAEIAFMDAFQAAGMDIRQRLRLDGPTGPEALWVVAAPPAALKRLAIRIEDTKPWGRLVDADVVVADVRRRPVPLGRQSLGYPDRECLVCGGPAKECIGSRRHHPAEAAQAAAGLIGHFTGSP